MSKITNIRRRSVERTDTERMIYSSKSQKLHLRGLEHELTMGHIVTNI